MKNKIKRITGMLVVMAAVSAPLVLSFAPNAFADGEDLVQVVGAL